MAAGVGAGAFGWVLRAKKGRRMAGSTGLRVLLFIVEVSRGARGAARVRKDRWVWGRWVGESWVGIFRGNVGAVH